MKTATNVLIVEDDKNTADSLKSFLKGQNGVGDVECASSVAEAYEFLKVDPMDVVVLDLIMPVSDGYSFLERMEKAAGRRPDIIVTSAIGQEDAIKRAFHLGAKYYMIKPYENNIMYRRIMDVCGLEDPKDGGDATAGEDHAAEKSIDQKIMEIFLTLGIPPHLKGYQYLREAIKIATDDPTAIYSITKYLYPEVARRFGVTATKVELAIRHTIEVAWQRNQMDNLNRVFGCDVYLRNAKPTNGEFIALVADKLVTEKK